MAEIIGKIDPKVLEERQFQAMLDDPKVLRAVREEADRQRKAEVERTFRMQEFKVERRKKKIEKLAEEKRVMSGKFNHIKIKGK